MDILEGIFTRRSIRKYTEREITHDHIETILKAGMYAPSARNEQPWHFIVITEKDILNSVKNVHPYAKMLQEVKIANLKPSNFRKSKSPV